MERHQSVVDNKTRTLPVVWIHHINELLAPLLLFWGKVIKDEDKSDSIHTKVSISLFIYYGRISQTSLSCYQLPLSDTCHFNQTIILYTFSSKCEWAPSLQWFDNSLIFSCITLSDHHLEDGLTFKCEIELQHGKTSVCSGQQNENTASCVDSSYQWIVGSFIIILRKGNKGRG